MSLLSNRGRFSRDERKKFNLDQPEYRSIVSLIGKNPNGIFKLDKNISNEEYSSSSTNNTKNNKVNNTKYSSNHFEYNKNLELKKDNYFDKYSDDYYDNKNKINIKSIIAMVIVEIFTLMGVIGFGTVVRYSKMTQNVSFSKSAVQNKNIDESTLAVMKGYKTVAIFGLDSRTGSVDKGNNSDVNLIINLNLETGEAQLVSIYRDLYLSITDNNSYDKFNAAYRKGGPQSAVKALNKNFDLNIDNFFSFNWKAVADGIELLGGIELEITKPEFKYMNAFIHETCIATGIDSKNPAAHYIKSAGMQHLDGVQSVAYGRLRLMDSDFQRVERQKKVISLCLEKAKTLDIPTLRLIIEAVLPQIAYEFDMNEMLSMLRLVKNINITTSCGVPDTNNVVSMDMGNSGDCVVPISLEKAVKKLHAILFNDEDYEPSTMVKRISNRITELRKKFAAENELKASQAESEALESIKEVLKPKKSTKSTIQKGVPKVATLGNTVKNNENLPISTSESKNNIPMNDLVESEVDNSVPINISPNESNLEINNYPDVFSKPVAVDVPMSNDLNTNTTIVTGPGSLEMPSLPDATKNIPNGIVTDGPLNNNSLNTTDVVPIIGVGPS